MNHTTNAMDIEIYVENLTLNDAVDWLNSLQLQLEPEQKRKGMPKNASPFSAVWQEQRFSLVVFEHVVSGYTSLWFDHPELPWEDDLACAQQAAKQLNKAVRVTAGGWQQQQDPDAWLEVTPSGEETELIWKT